MNQKVRKHSGRVCARMVFDGANKKEVLDDCLESREFWDDWKDHRDGFRGDNDKKQKRSVFMRGADCFDVKKWNRKLKKLVLRRKLRKK